MDCGLLGLGWSDHELGPVNSEPPYTYGSNDRRPSLLSGSSSKCWDAETTSHLLSPSSPAAKKERVLRASMPQRKRGKRRSTSQPPFTNVLLGCEDSCSSATTSSLSHSRVLCTLDPSSDEPAVAPATSPLPLCSKEREGLAQSKFEARSGSGPELAPRGQTRTPISGGSSKQFVARLRPSLLLPISTGRSGVDFCHKAPEGSHLEASRGIW